MDRVSGARPPKRLLVGGVHMGKPLAFFASGALGHIFTCDNNGSHLLVKQLQEETDGGSELVKEYHIADFSGTILPDFVAAPFALMRGFSTSHDYDEKLCLLQQRVHGKTIFDIDAGDFTKKELWSIFLQFNEFILRLGDKVIMDDVHSENVMVDVREPGAPRVNFFRFWILEGGRPHPIKVVYDYAEKFVLCS
jgi:hypothetical protein